LLDSTGAATTVTLDANINDSWSSGSGTGDANHTLLNGILKSNGTFTSTYVFHNVPAGQYNLVAYTMENGTGGIYDATVGSTTFRQEAQNGPDFNGTLVQGTNTDTTTTTPPVANYVEFTNVSPNGTGDLTFSYNHVTGSDGVGIAGLQLQSAPEPATVGLLGLGALGLLARRRSASR
jgi:hypothetical protein